jgi:V8-like Glu-specific endopeptidase
MRPGSYQLTVRARDSTRSADVLVAPGTLVQVEIGLQQAEVVIGVDDRVLVTNNELYPWRCVCSLVITAANGVQRSGTGWLVSPRLVLTAGQHVYLPHEGGWASQIEVIPGRNGTARPFGSAICQDFRSLTGWVNNSDPDYNCGAILLPADQRYGDTLGWFGYTVREDEYLRGLTLNLSGYPADGGRTGQQDTHWFHSGPVKEVLEKQISYEIDTSEGQSGAPVWEMTGNGERYGVAIHNETVGTSINHGVRITQDLSDNIGLWISQAP